MVKKSKLAFIIPTKGRYKDLEILLDSIENQTLKPDLITIVDANREYSENKLKNYSFPIKYIHTGPNSLTEARNIGIRNVPEDFDLVGFFDDDIMLCDGAIDDMFFFWHHAPEKVGGASFNIINRSVPKLTRVEKLFVLNSLKKGELLRSGFNTSLYPVTADKKVQWLSGGNTIWRKELLNKFKFDENLKGYGLTEDLDFSYGVGKCYELFVVAKAIVKHFPHSVRKKRAFRLGLMEVTNRYYFLRKHKEFSIILFYWAFLGLIIRGIISGIKHLEFTRLKRTSGNIIGVCCTLVLKGKLPRGYEYSDIKD